MDAATRAPATRTAATATVELLHVVGSDIGAVRAAVGRSDAEWIVLAEPGCGAAAAELSGHSGHEASTTISTAPRAAEATRHQAELGHHLAVDECADVVVGVVPAGRRALGPRLLHLGFGFGDTRAGTVMARRTVLVDLLTDVDTVRLLATEVALRARHRGVAMRTEPLEGARRAGGVSGVRYGAVLARRTVAIVTGRSGGDALPGTAAPLAATVAKFLLFGAVGVASGAVFVLAYVLLRTTTSAPVANFLALAASALFNIEANRVWTFRATPVPRWGMHVRSAALFVAHYLLMTGAVVALLAVHPTAGPAVEVGTLLAADAVMTVLRFLGLHLWVFRARTQPEDPTPEVPVETADQARNGRPGSWLEVWNGPQQLHLDDDRRDEHFRHLAEQLIALVPGPDACVLDYGPGEATTAGLVADHAGHLVLCEASDLLRADLERRYADDERITVVAGGGLDPVPDASVDLMVVNSVVQYLSRAEFLELLAVAHRVLRPTGVLAVGDVVPESTGLVTDVVRTLRDAVGRRTLRASVRALLGIAFSPYARTRARLGLRRYDAATMTTLLRDAGFDVARHHPNLSPDTTRATFLARPAGR